jgi:hypothetical protein
MTPAQLLALRNDINADPVLGGLPVNQDQSLIIAAAYNQLVIPDYWVWKTKLTEQEIYEATSSDDTVWSWTTYINQTAREADAWGRMFASGRINPSLPQVQDAYSRIFSGSTQAVQAQRAHLLAISRRLATRIEKLLRTSGAGTTADPAELGFEGNLNAHDVDLARAN